MKKYILLIITILIMILATLISKYYDYKNEYSKLKEFNLKYEQYSKEEIYGTALTTIINMAVDDNVKANATKENEDYISIQIKIIDISEDDIYTMETLYNGGMVQFVQYYGSIIFKCQEIKYNSKGKINYMLFEQIST